MRGSVQLGLAFGASVPLPAPPHVMEALEAVEIESGDEGRSGFQITFLVGRDRNAPRDYALLEGPSLELFSRVRIWVAVDGRPEGLIDGFVTDRQLNPGEMPGTTTLTVTGEDVSVMMDLEERSEEHPAQSVPVIVTKLILRYKKYGLVPDLGRPGSLETPLPTDRIPVQQGTDLEYLTELAKAQGFVFFVEPGPVPGTNRAFWGPPDRVGVPQKPLTVNMGPYTNVSEVDFRENGLAATRVTGEVQDRSTNRSSTVDTPVSTRPPLSSRPAWLRQSHVRVRRLRESGIDLNRAREKAQAILDDSVDEVVTASGRLDVASYGAVLRPRRLVSLRGAGHSHNGLYYVKRVSHSLSRGSYTQGFTLARDGTGSLVPTVAL